LKRLGIPLVVFGVVVDQIWDCGDPHRWGHWTDLIKRSYWIDAQWLSHLWFIAVLIQYTVFLFLAARFCPRMLAKITQLELGLKALYVITALGYVVGLRIAHYASIPSLVFVRPVDTFCYLIFFAVGYYLFHHQQLLGRLAKHPNLNLILVLAFLVAVPYLSGLRHSAVLQLCQAAYVLSICGLIFWTGARYFDKPSAWISRFSDAAYTMYLLHWILMNWFYYWLQRFHVSWWAAFPTLIVTTFAASYLLHAYVVKRFQLAAILINGEFSQRNRIPMAPVMASSFVWK
jgi:glucan biosynthesis protein C